MGYTIKIGNLKNQIVEDVYLPYAPADGSPNDHQNSRWPSYSGWADFCESAKIESLMGELMPDHPGLALIEKRHVEEINSIESGRLPEIHRGRIEWLKFWMNWAIENCENPAFYNN